MSTPTGNVYLQIYNKETNKYVELPSSVGSISFVKTPTGLSTVNGYDANFSGFNISKSVKIDGSINISPINIGLGNVTGSGFRVINIGQNNSNIFLASGFITSGFDGGANIGVGNIGRDSTITFNIGSTNSSRENSHQVYNFGANNYVENGFFINNIGILNSTITGNKVFNLGVSNQIYSGKSSFVIGIQNNVNLSDTLYAIGNFNNFQEANFNKSFGDGIDISGSSNVLNLGDDNVVYDSDQIIILNNDNNVLDSEAQTILGKNNVILNSTNNTIVGQYNFVKSTNTNLFGDQNIAQGTGNYAYGNLNSIMSGNSDSSIYGTSNSMSGNDTSLILGYSNLVMSGTENFILGYGNEIIASKNSVVLGQENKSIDTNKSYIFGENNVVGTRVENSYVFGQNNSTSGFQNYVFGNDNTVRSGDYNSIFIGISYTPTGDSKVATISLGVVDSKIEISPSEIRLDSPNRLKTNGENIIIQSDLNSYLTSSNGLSSKQTITPYKDVFNDSSYFGLPNQIQIQPFIYSGNREAWSSEITSWTEGYGIQTFDGSFIKKAAATYAGNYPPLTDYYLQSKTQDYKVVFANVGVETGSWLITTDVGGGILDQQIIFYNTGSIANPINSSSVPSNDWTGMTFDDPLNAYYGIAPFDTYFSGLEPYPIFEYYPFDTGVINAEKITATGQINTNSFSNLGTLGYSSTTQGISILYGTHSTPQFNPSWIVIDNFSSGMYAINRSGSFSSFPQSGWISTGFLGFSGRNIYNQQNPLETPNPLTKISLSKSGLVSSSDAILGKIYVPFLY